MSMRTKYKRVGRPRKHHEPYATTTVELYIRQIDGLETLSRSRGCSRGDVIRAAVELFLAVQRDEVVSAMEAERDGRDAVSA